MAKPVKTDPATLSALSRLLLKTESVDVRKKMIIGLAAICALLAFADLVYHRHGKFDMETWFNFYGFAGFAAFTFIIYATKALKHLLSRKEDYYGEGAVDSEEYPPHKLGIKGHDDA